MKEPKTQEDKDLVYQLSKEFVEMSNSDIPPMDKREIGRMIRMRIAVITDAIKPCNIRGEENGRYN